MSKVDNIIKSDIVGINIYDKRKSLFYFIFYRKE